MEPARTPWYESLLAVVGQLAATATVVSLAAPWWWLADVLRHFPAHTLLGCLAGTLALRSHRRTALLCGLAATFQGVRLAPLAPYATNSPGDLTLATHNVHTESRAFAGTTAWLDRGGLDVVCLPEVDADWLAALDEVASLTAVEAVPRDDNFGIALYVHPERIRVRASRVVPTEPPQIEATLETAAGPVDVLVTHTLPPVSARHAAVRDAQLRWIGDWMAKHDGAAVVCGDLNTTRWSAHFPTGVRSARDGRGYLGTWPSVWYLPRTIPIDHVFARGLEVRAAEVGPDVGSDHLPLVVALALP
jgi:endonuclease/exonuclease/phosphatase (EEP) superfamily protein YafD